ncbi:MAG: hypothetical protein QF363_04165 [Planctomycetaceae bacterium]|jgi:hypothetical protein|nr:hypothetical protein [Planctomycetaceae bacterium]
MSIKKWLPIVLAIATAVTTAADPVPLTRRGVDRLKTAEGQPVLGAVLHRSNRDGLAMAVRREWLRAEDPGRLARIDAGLAESVPRGWRRLRDRIDRWRDELGKDDPLHASLKAERNRLDTQIRRFEEQKKLPATRFVIVHEKLPGAESLLIQPLLQKRVALVAWSEGLARVESRSVEDLREELGRKNIDVTKVSVESLWQQLPPVNDNLEQWMVRRALKSCGFVAPLHFQGTGRVLIPTKPTGEAGAIDGRLVVRLLGDLVSELVGRKRGSATGDTDDPLLDAARQAETAGKPSFRITRFRHDLKQRRTIITSEFLAKVGQQWVVVWQASETIAVRDRPEFQRRIERDPRIKPVLDLARKLGLAKGDQAVKTALEFGAATMDGQNRIDSWFLIFRDRYLHQLDGPPLWWSRKIRTGDEKRPDKPGKK